MGKITRIRTLTLLEIISIGGMLIVGISNNSNAQIGQIDPRATALGYLGADAWPTNINPVIIDPIIETKIANMIAVMSAEEKVGQIIQAEIQYTTPDDVRRYHLGSVLSGGGSAPNRNKNASPNEWLALADAYYEASMDISDDKIGIPIIWGIDAVHGHNNIAGATIFPHNIGIGATRNPELARKIGQITAMEMSVTGINWTFAPTVAVAQNDRWGRVFESYSEDPAIVKLLAEKMITGLQGVPNSKEFLDVNHVIATAKHFIGDGGTSDGKDQGDTRISETELRNIHAQGYVGALTAGVQASMASLSSWNGIAMHGHKYMLTDILKNRMGLDGLIIGDWNGHSKIPGCSDVSCPQAINAGVDLFMAVENWKLLYANTLRQVNFGKIPMSRLNDAVTRILRVKHRAGLFENGKPSSRGSAGKSGIIGNAEHRAIARQAVRESLVLLKNNNSVLPLNPTQNILIVGSDADSIGNQSGGWSLTWQGTGNDNSDFPGGTSILDGFREAIEEAGGNIEFSSDGSFDRYPDVAVMVYGENPYAEWHGDIDTLEFEARSKPSLAILRRLKSSNIPIVSVFLAGRPLWVNPELDISDAFVAAWLPGSEGAGVADVLLASRTGKPMNDFKGHLPFSWPKRPDQFNLNSQQLQYSPLFKLGYGLTYKSSPQTVMLPESVEFIKPSENITQLAETSTLNLHVGKVIIPWQVYISTQNISQWLRGPYVALPNDVLAIRTKDKNLQEDALEAIWSGTQKARVYIKKFNILDLNKFLASDGIISFDVKIDNPLSTPFLYGIECGENCVHSVDLKDYLNSIVGKGWQNLSIKLSCLSEREEVFSNVTTPFYLESTGEATISFANVKFIKNKNANYQCLR